APCLISPPVSYVITPSYLHEDSAAHRRCPRQLVDHNGLVRWVGRLGGRVDDVEGAVLGIPVLFCLVVEDVQLVSRGDLHRQSPVRVLPCQVLDDLAAAQIWAIQPRVRIPDIAVEIHVRVLVLSECPGGSKEPYPVLQNRPADGSAVIVLRGHSEGGRQASLLELRREISASQPAGDARRNAVARHRLASGGYTHGDL